MDVRRADDLDSRRTAIMSSRTLVSNNNQENRCSMCIWFGRLLRVCPSCRSLDRISSLEDDVLLKILSDLVAGDAGMTALLSSRWRGLWELTPSLKLIHPVCSLKDDDPDEYRRKFVLWVDSIFAMHRGRHLTDCCIACPLNSRQQATVERWLRLVLGYYDVERLELKFTPIRPQFLYAAGSFLFPDPLHSNLFDDVYELKCLKSLRLFYVEVTIDGLKHIIQNCLLLEELYVEGNNNSIQPAAQRPRFGPHYSLQYCCFINWRYFENLELFDFVNLKKLVVPALSNLVLLNLPKLADLSIQGGSLSTSPFNAFRQVFYSFGTRLEVLSLSPVKLEELAYWHRAGFTTGGLPELRELDITLLLRDTQELGRLLALLVSLIEICPRLRVVKLTVRRTRTATHLVADLLKHDILAALKKAGVKIVNPLVVIL